MTENGPERVLAGKTKHNQGISREGALCSPEISTKSAVKDGSETKYTAYMRSLSKPRHFDGAMQKKLLEKPKMFFQKTLDISLHP